MGKLSNAKPTTGVRMTVRAQAASSETAVNTDSLVTNALGQSSQITLPAINAGAGATVSVGKHMRISNTGGGVVDVLTATGRILTQVPAGQSVAVVAVAGVVQGGPDIWQVMPLASNPNTFLAPGAGYVQADSVAIVACLVAHGLMKAE